MIDYRCTVTAAVFLNSRTFLPSALEDDTRTLPRLPPRREPIITVDANIMQIGVALATGFGSTRLLSSDNFYLKIAHHTLLALAKKDLLHHYSANTTSEIFFHRFGKDNRHIKVMKFSVIIVTLK